MRLLLRRLKKKEKRIFNIVNIAQGVAIFLAANIAKNIGHPEWFVPAFIFIVGAHFIPLAKVFHSRRHTVIGVAMMVWALAYPQLAQVALLIRSAVWARV
jgi:hypothetical protein